MVLQIWRNFDALHKTENTEHSFIKDSELKRNTQFLTSHENKLIDLKQLFNLSYNWLFLLRKWFYLTWSFLIWNLADYWRALFPIVTALTQFLYQERDIICSWILPVKYLDVCSAVRLSYIVKQNGCSLTAAFLCS